MKSKFVKMKKTGIPTRADTTPTNILPPKRGGYPKRSTQTKVSVPNNSRNRRYNKAALKRAAKQGWKV